MAKKPTYEELEKRGKKLEKKADPEDSSGNELKLFKAIVEASSEAIAISDPGGQLVYVNPAHEKLFDRSLDEAQKMNYRDYYPRESVERLDREVAPALERGESWEGVLQARDRNNRCFPLWERADALRDKRGKMLYGFGIMHDVSELQNAREELQKAHDQLEEGVEERTSELARSNEQLKREIEERKQAEEALRESEEKYRTLAENSLTGVFIHQDGKYVFVNETFAEIHGYTPAELVGKEALMLIYPDDRPFAEEILSTRLKGGSAPERYEIRRLNKEGGAIWCEMMASRIEYAGSPAIMGNVIDITERRRLQDQLRQAQKMQAIGTLAGGTAHDFNNILSIVLGNAELAMDEIPEWYAAQHNLKEIRQACLRAKDVVKQILSFSRQATHEQKPVSLAPVIKEALTFLRSTIPTTIDIHQHIFVESDTVLADSTQIHQVLINLCTNATQAMSEEGGVLDVSLEGLRIHEEEAAGYPGLGPGYYVMLTVKDTGHGIDPSIGDRIFEPYFTTKEVGQGSGMGLAVVHGIVRSHGGTITVDSVPGEGATARVFLPRIEGEVTPESHIIEAIPGGSERILFVDDEKPLVSLAKAMLERLGYDVIARKSSVEALNAFRQAPDTFDLVITDMTMPDMAGDRLAVEMMKIRSNIPVILCTGHSARINEDKALAMGIRAFLMKPFLKRDVAKTIRRVLDD